MSLTCLNGTFRRDAIETDARHSIGDGPPLDVGGNARRWFARDTIRQRRGEMRLGSAADVGLKEARQLVADVRETVKAGREHRVPLPTRAFEILNEAPTLRESEEPTAYRFASRRRGSTRPHRRQFGRAGLPTW